MIRTAMDQAEELHTLGAVPVPRRYDDKRDRTTSYG